MDKPLSRIAAGIRKRGTKGAFKAQAVDAGKSTAAYARQVLKKGSKASTTTKRRAVLAQTFAKFRKGK